MFSDIMSSVGSSRHVLDLKVPGGQYAMSLVLALRVESLALVLVLRLKCLVLAISLWLVLDRYQHQNSEETPSLQPSD